MIPFPFFISREPVYKTVAPAVSDSRNSDVVCVPCKTSRHVSEGDLYRGLDLKVSTSRKMGTRALVKN